MAKRYRVTAPTAVLDTEPGKTFEAELDPIQEERLLVGGHLEIEGETPSDDLASLPLEELDEIAHDLGVENPESLPDDTAVIQAIVDAVQTSE